MTLLVACAFFVLSMRTVVIWDCIRFTSGDHQHLILSAENRILLCRWKQRKHDTSQNSWDTITPTGGRLYRKQEFEDLKWRTASVELQYWSLVVPLTLLSAWLILGKRPKGTERDNRKPPA